MSISIFELLLRLVAAAGFGAIIGLEREAKARPAGLRTHMLTSLAAAVFTIMALELHSQVEQLPGDAETDPLRILEAVTAGVAFLAAGTIIRGRGQVQGITTGAGMWLAGSIGLACGAGNYTVAAFALILAVLILAILRPIEKWLWPEQSRQESTPTQTPSGPDGET